MAWQLDRVPRDASFENAIKHRSEWLTNRVGQPQSITPGPQFNIWYYDRGHFQVEVAVDRQGIIRAVRYLHQRRR